jgi:hypothetical protein
MKILRATLAVSALFVSLAVPALAGVTVNSPSNSAQVASPFSLSATAFTCASQNVTAMGYSLDNSSDTTIAKGQSIDTSVGSASGAHVLHVKAWGDGGSACVADVSITVSSGGSIIPESASVVGDLEAMGNWQAQHDDGGPGSSTGYTDIVNSPSLNGSARRFVTDYTNAGDERYAVGFSDDTQATNFFYDAWVYLTSSSSNIANLEFDTNQTMPNGMTVMIGVQCDGYSGKWDYTVNEGGASNPQPHWVGKSGSSCNPRGWSQWTWHHVQAYYSHDDSGWITYHSVWLDGVETELNTTVFGGFDLGWPPLINTQFQVDGLGSGGHTTVYVDNLTISRW